MNFSARKKRHITEINLTPLIDIVFNLLIFFLITTTFVQNPGIEVDLPKATQSAEQANDDAVIVAVTEEGRLIYGGAAVSIDELREKLEEKRGEREDDTVIIQADAETPHGKVVEVMDLARQIGYRQLAIATEAE